MTKRTLIKYSLELKFIKQHKNVKHMQNEIIFFKYPLHDLNNVVGMYCLKAPKKIAPEY